MAKQESLVVPVLYLDLFWPSSGNASKVQQSIHPKTITGVLWHVNRESIACHTLL